MKRVILVLMGCGLGATWIGCQGDAGSTTADPGDSRNATTSTAGDSATSEYTLVTLIVPNMT